MNDISIMLHVNTDAIVNFCAARMAANLEVMKEAKEFKNEEKNHAEEVLQMIPPKNTLVLAETQKLTVKVDSQTRFHVNPTQPGYNMFQNPLSELHNTLNNVSNKENMKPFIHNRFTHPNQLKIGLANGFAGMNDKNGKILFMHALSQKFRIFFHEARSKLLKCPQNKWGAAHSPF